MITMKGTYEDCLLRLPAVDVSVAFLILLPEARCHCPQCRVTDYLFTKDYQTAALERSAQVT